ncbi:MAG: sugar phosphate isomerase/epimerase [Anaerolineae bacterium]|nr:sugar phosphate isomerase/epimerase [Anaerolineae bacterium]
MAQEASIGVSFHSGGLVDSPFDEVIRRLARAGYDAVEIVCGPEAHLRTAEPLGPQIERARGLLEETGLAVSAINPYTAPALVNYARDDLDGALGFWGSLLQIAYELGSRNVNFLPGWLPEGDTAAWKLLIEVLRRLCEMAEKLGVNLAIHNHEAHIIDAPGKCLVLMDHVGSDRLKVLCDITNFHILGSDIGDTVRLLGPHIVHCHLKGVRGRYPYQEFLVPGEEGDELDVDGFVEALVRIGYRGYISVECFRWMRADRPELGCATVAGSLRRVGTRRERGVAASDEEAGR